MNKELGGKFKKKREEMHLSLKEVENATSISMSYIQAIEEGAISKHLSPVYSMGFFKQYANFLGFDAEKIIEENPSVFSYKNNEGEKEDFGINSVDTKNVEKVGSKWGSNFFWIGISLSVLVAAWYFAKFLGLV